MPTRHLTLAREAGAAPPPPPLSPLGVLRAAARDLSNARASGRPCRGCRTPCSIQRKDPVNRGKRGARAGAAGASSGQMATLEHEQPLLSGPQRATSDRHVFAAATGRRAGALRLAGICVATLSLVWLGALAIALLGAGPGPGILPAATALSVAPRAAAPHVRAPRAAPARVLRRAWGALRSVTPAAPERVLRTAVAVAQAPTPVRAVSARAPVTPPAAPPAPAAAGQGWTRHGWTAPPGRVKHDQPPSRRAGGHSGDAADSTRIPGGQSGAHARSPR